MEKQAMSFGLVCQWLGMKAANAEDHTLCSLEIRAGDYTLTRNIAENSANISDSAVVSAWPLAAWLAWNWWRLLYETGPFRKSGLHVRPSVDWKRAHYLPAADYGYQWPRISLVSDEKFVHIHMAPDPADDIRLARYIGNFGNILVPRDDFARGIGDFLKEVDERLEGRFADDELRGLVSQLFEEIGEESLAEYRKIEAMTGYDPDDAPPELVRYGRVIIHKYGQGFFNEMASSINRSFLRGSRPAESPENICSAAEEVGRHGISGKFVLGADVLHQAPDYAAPWDYGRAFARLLRGQIGLPPDSCLDSSALRAWFEIGEDDLKNGLSCGESGICHRDGAALKFRFANESSWQYRRNRRFFLAWLAGACLDDPDANSSWLAIGPGATWGQKMQRAFAAELLAPIEAIRSMRPSRPLDRSDVEKIADHFDVTPYTIVHSLANHNEIGKAEAAMLVA